MSLAWIMQIRFGTISPFQVLSCNVKRSPVLGDSGVRLGTRIEVSGEGVLTADTPADFAAAIGDLVAATDQAAQDVVITGLGGVVIVSLLAAQCVENGPQVEIELSDGTAPLQQKIKFKATGATAGTGDSEGDDVVDEYTITTETKTNELQVVTYSGSLLGPNLLAWIRGTKLGQVKAAHPWPQWSINYTWALKESAGVESATYSIVVSETSESLPSGGGAKALAGTLTTSSEINAQWQKVTVQQSEFDFSGDPDELHDALRPRDVLIVQESKEVQSVSGSSLRSRFTFITGSEGDKCIGFDQVIGMDQADPIYEEKQFPGSKPVLVKQPQRYRRLRQSGSIRGAGVFLEPPEPIFDLLAEPPEISLSDPQKVEKIVGWTYVMYVPSDLGSDLVAQMISRIARPAQATPIGITPPAQETP